MPQAELIRKIDRAPLRQIMAPAFAAALAFALFAMPEWRLSQGVAVTGLPAVVGAAQPPLGLTARLLVMIFVASAGGAAIWALFAWLERPRTRRPANSQRIAVPSLESEIPPAAPVLRRADAHPDAPARRPIFAASDLGAPLDEAPEPVWREDARRLSSVPSADSGVFGELLLDHQLDATSPTANESLAASAASLMTRLEGGLRRRGGTAPQPDAGLRDALLQLQGGRG